MANPFETYRKAAQASILDGYPEDQVMLAIVATMKGNNEDITAAIDYLQKNSHALSGSSASARAGVEVTGEGLEVIGLDGITEV